jgi:hypothetical protein
MALDKGTIGLRRSWRRFRLRNYQSGGSGLRDCTNRINLMLWTISIEISWAHNNRSSSN